MQRLVKLNELYHNTEHHKVLYSRGKNDECYTPDYGVEPILKYIPENKHFGFDNLMYKLLKLKKRIKVKPHNGYWIDIGRPSDYIVATEQFTKMKKKLLHV